PRRRRRRRHLLAAAALRCADLRASSPTAPACCVRHRHCSLNSAIEAAGTGGGGAMATKWRSRGILTAVALAVPLTWLRGAGGQAVPPVLTLSPTSGPAGTTVQATGSRFRAAICDVSLALDAPTGTALGSAAV